MQLCSILLFSWSIWENCYVRLRMSSSKTQMLLLEKTIYSPQILTVLLEIHSVYIWLLWPFAFCLSNDQWNYSVDHLALLTGFRTDFASSVLNFCRWVADILPRETSLSGDKRGETSIIRRLCFSVPGVSFQKLCKGVKKMIRSVNAVWFHCGLIFI